MEVVFLVLPGGKRPAEDFLTELDNKTVAKIYKLIERLEIDGRLIFPHARKLEGYKGLWEMRVNSQRGAVRIFYVYSISGTIILVSGFIKKSQETPKRELEKAVGYLKQVGVVV